MAEQRTVGFVLFDKFELLDVFGPAEAYGAHDLEGAFKVVLVARRGGPCPPHCFWLPGFTEEFRP